MSRTQLLAPGYAQMLTALAAWVRKAQSQLPEAEAEALLSARLAPDMYPLATQIRFACVQAREAVHRLRGEAIPDNVAALQAEGVNAGEDPGTIEAALGHIESTVELLGSLDPDGLDTAAGEAVELALANGMNFQLTADQYARDWSLPQFYFHLMTAYALLRHNGIELGKADYVPHMVGYLAQPAG
ncbi:MAG: DUF1993 domain-containing protein [Pseudomonadota bacterium]